MNNHLPIFISKTAEFEALAKAFEPEAVAVSKEVKTVPLEGILSEMSEQRTEEWAALLELSFLPGESLSDKRETVASAFCPSGLTFPLLKQYLVALCGGPEGVLINMNYNKLTLSLGLGLNESALVAANETLRTVVPANINLRVMTQEQWKEEFVKV